jgi:hypothetical protein
MSAVSRRSTGTASAIKCRNAPSFISMAGRPGASLSGSPNASRPNYHRKRLFEGRMRCCTPGLYEHSQGKRGWVALLLAGRTEVARQSDGFLAGVPGATSES